MSALLWLEVAFDVAAVIILAGIGVTLGNFRRIQGRLLEQLEIMSSWHGQPDQAGDGEGWLP